MKLRRNLGLAEVLGMSIALIAPTMAVAFNVALTAHYAGSAAPLAFIIGMAVMGVVGLSFVACSRRVSHAGAAYAYIGTAFGPHAGFVAGWAMLLVYLALASGTIVLVGSFLESAASGYGVHLNRMADIISIAALGLATFFAFRDMKFATRLMLVLEGLSLGAIVILGCVILFRAFENGTLSAAPFRPDPAYGWSGIGGGLVFAVLSFAGFEGVATLAEESAHPHRTIPLALIGTVVLGGIFFVFASFIEVTGFGADHAAALAGDASPLNTLGTRYISREFGTALILAAAISTFSGSLGCLSAASRILFAMGRGGFGRWAAVVHPSHGTPARAVLFSGLCCLCGIVCWESFAGPARYYDAVGTIGVLALILVYAGVTLAEAVYAFSRRQLFQGALAVLGSLLLLWPLGSTLWPVPDYPASLWPYLVLLWLAIGGVITVLRPAVNVLSVVPEESDVRPDFSDAPASAVRRLLR